MSQNMVMIGIRKIVIDNGTVTTLAGRSSDSIDGTWTSAIFDEPRTITIYGTNLYVADYGNDRIRKIALRGSESAAVALHNLDDDVNVTVDVSSSNTSEATVSPSTLTFTPTNWQTNQAVIVTGVNDSNQDGHQDYDISLSATGHEINDDPVVTTRCRFRNSRFFKRHRYSSKI